MTEPRAFRPQQFWHDPKTEFAFHAAAQEYPLMPKKELTALIEDMRENGFDARYPIALLDEQIADGRNRYLAAREADVEFLTTTVQTGTDPERYVIRANEHRRHLTQEWLTAKRQERIERAAAARAEGQSTRQIAEDEGVSQTQILRDLEEAAVSTEPGVSVETRSGIPEEKGDFSQSPPKTIVGKDKKKRKARTKKKVSEPSANGKEQTLLDEVDFEVPAGLIPVFQKAEEFRKIVNQLNAINRTLIDLSKHPAGACMRLQGAQVDLKNLKETVRFDAPYAVCPQCKGVAKTRKANCPCKQRGWLVEGSYKNLPQEMRA